MKGIILAGGSGRRLDPLTRVTNKHLLPIYDKPMIYYPLQTLIDAGIKDILIVSGPGHAGDFVNLLGSGKELGIRLSYEIQYEPGGIAQALGLAEDYSEGDSICVILGDNIFEDKLDLTNYSGGARVFLKEVPDPERFGVAEVKDGKIVSIEEKPIKPKSNLVTTGLYIYDSRVFDIIKTLKPSGRGELEITDVNNNYVNEGKMDSKILMGKWSDAGTFESLFHAGTIARGKLNKD